MTDSPLELLNETFAGLALGPVPNTYSPWGEYHCHPDEGRLGRWREATTHYSWRDSCGIWSVVEDDGRHVMEASWLADTSYPLLITGDATWRTYTLEAGIRRLSTARECGIVVAYQHSRNFVVLLFGDGDITLAQRRHGEDTILASSADPSVSEGWRAVTIDCGEQSVAVSLDGQPLLEAHGLSLAGGPIGLLANAPTRFADVRVTTTDSPVAPASPAGLRASYPQPRLWRKLSTRGFGTDRNLRVGDIDGDGENEIVIAQHSRHLGSGDYCEISAMMALRLSGEQLWQIGEPSPQRWETTADLCFQLHDLDGDGRAELLYTREFELRVADGATGRTLRTTATHESVPPRAAGAWPLRRVIGDCLYFCDFTGDGRQDTVVLKDRYEHCWAYDSGLHLLWDHACKTGHYPTSYDIDGDGREELLMGYTLLDAQGRVIWRLDAIDHADSSVMWHNSAGEPTVAVAGSDAGFYLLNGQGATVAHYPIGHAQTTCLAKLRADVPGLQLIVNTYWGEPGVTIVLDERGALLHEFEPMHYACLLQPVNWTDNGADLVLLSPHVEEGGLIDGFGRRVVVFPDDGHPVLCSDVKDIDGDGVDEILCWDYDSIWIYKPDRDPKSRPYPMRNPFHNDSSYRGQWSKPAE